MTKFHQKQIDQVKTEMIKQINELSNKVDQSSVRDVAQDRVINSKIALVQKD